jgi:hypothetical protein
VAGGGVRAALKVLALAQQIFDLALQFVMVAAELLKMSEQVLGIEDIRAIQRPRLFQEALVLLRCGRERIS